jgi:thymidylate synthase (FAD)|tara:strand:+ start:1041 stop:1721 length:681 start_codon:yes stop_codon:yes gene_type:complete
MQQSVKLIGLTSPSAITGTRTAEELVAYAARVSNPGNQNNEKTAPKLLSYLIKENHWSPFEMVSMTMEIVTTRDISRQIIRHRSFSFQEFSQRYAVSNDFVTREARLQDKKNRQNSIAIDRKDVKQIELAEEWNMQQVKLTEKIKKLYKWALDNGIAKEQARAILPEGNTMTTLYMSGTLRSWIHYCQLRKTNGTQAEHMEVAELAWKVIEAQFPNVTEAVDNLDS